MFGEGVVELGDEPIDLVRDAVKLATDGLDEVGPRQLAERLAVLERARRMVTAAVAEVVAVADRTEAFREDGHLTVRSWVNATVNTTRGEALHDVRLAHLTAAHPVVAAELAGGRLGVAQARAMATTASNPRVADQFGPVVEPLLDSACRDPYDVFAQTLHGWERLADADGAHHDHDAAHAGRRARIAVVGDCAYLDASFAAVHGVELQTILDRFTHAEFLAEWEDLKARHGDDACPALLERSDAQRRADALLAVFRRAASSPPGGAAPEPVVNIVISQDVFEEQLAAVVEGRRPDFADLDPTRSFCLTTSGAPVHPAAAVAAAMVGHVRRVVIDARRVVTDFGRRSRVFTGAAREAFLVQSVLQTAGRCLWPGCGRRQNQIDHTDEWGSGGPTDLVNAGPACGRHNIWKSRGYTCWRDDHGRWHVTRPDGTEIESC